MNKIIELIFLTFVLTIAFGNLLLAQDIENKNILKLNDSTTLKLPEVFVKLQLLIFMLYNNQSSIFY